jgi:hypothetical protein
MRIFAILVVLTTQHLVVAAQTRVVILGVDHSAQLVSRAYRPAVVEAFIARVKPDAICIERDPEDFATGDFYEFTYEVSEICVPSAAVSACGASIVFIRYRIRSNACR